MDSVEAWDLLSDEIQELPDPEFIQPVAQADFSFVEIDDYKGLALIADPSTSQSTLYSFTYEKGWKIEQEFEELIEGTSILTDFRYFHCNYTVKQVLDLPFVE